MLRGYFLMGEKMFVYLKFSYFIFNDFHLIPLKFSENVMISSLLKNGVYWKDKLTLYSTFILSMLYENLSLFHYFF